jgi:hypothetical protein
VASQLRFPSTESTGLYRLKRGITASGAPAAHFQGMNIEQKIKNKKSFSSHSRNGLSPPGFPSAVEYENAIGL